MNSVSELNFSSINEQKERSIVSKLLLSFLFFHPAAELPEKI
jgi:hypothetical protein